MPHSLTPEGLLPTCYTLPAVFSNQINFAFVNGMVRLTFLEQIVTPNTNIVMPRVAVILTLSHAKDLAEQLSSAIVINEGGKTMVGSLQ